LEKEKAGRGWREKCGTLFGGLHGTHFDTNERLLTIRRLSFAQEGVPPYGTLFFIKKMVLF